MAGQRGRKLTNEKAHKRATGRRSRRGTRKRTNGASSNRRAARCRLGRHDGRRATRSERRSLSRGTRVREAGERALEMEVPGIMRRAANVERNEGTAAGEGRRVEEGLRGAWLRVYKGKFARLTCGFRSGTAWGWFSATHHHCAIAAWPAEAAAKKKKKCRRGGVSCASSNVFVMCTFPDWKVVSSGDER